MDFLKHCPNWTVIIDCFEIFIYRPSDLVRVQTYSSNKPQDTVKHLIGLTPKSVVSYMSNGWGRRVSA